jgi:hypothetical protein
MFRGWRREVHAHDVQVAPVIKEGGRYRPLTSQKALRWSNALIAYGKVSDLALSGAFLAKFEFRRAELQRWLAQYLIENPEDGLLLIAEAQAEAIRNLAKQTK